MTIHSQEVETGGIRIAYLVQPVDDADKVVRKALRMESTRLMNLRDIPLDPLTPEEAYIVDGPLATVYHQPYTIIHETACSVTVPKDEKPMVVAIRSTLAPGLPTPTLEQFINIAFIQNALVPAGLVPMDSTREEIPGSYLRSTI